MTLTSMRHSQILVTLAGVIILSCLVLTATGQNSNTSTAKQALVPTSIAGLKMHFSDLHGNYLVTFHKDGTYAFTSSRENHKSETRRGKYLWRVLNARKAVLDLDEGERYTLSFDSPLQATGYAADDVRPYNFKFFQ